MEEWKDVVGYEGLYEVSNLGNVRSIDREIKCKNGNVQLFKGKVISQYDNGKGYKNVTLWKNNKPKIIYVHRLVAIAFIENKLEKPCINHIDKNRGNNNVSNLEWCTQKENEFHKLTFGDLIYSKRQREILSERMKGENNPSVKNPKYRGDNSAAKKVLCGGKVFECVKDCAEFYNINYGTMRCWLSKNGKPPKSFEHKDLRYL